MKSEDIGLHVVCREGRGHRQTAVRALSLMTVIVNLAACSSTTSQRPTQGSALLDITPDRERQDRIRGQQLVSVNGIPTRGTEVSLKPGRNVVRTRFEWPQGGAQEVDLSFRAKAGRTYFVQYEPSPPMVNRLDEMTEWDESAKGFAYLGASAGEAAFLMVPPVAVFLGAGFMKRVGNQIAERSRPASQVDIMVISRHDGEGMMRRLRAFPDGRVDSATWAAWAK